MNHKKRILRIANNLADELIQSFKMTPKEWERYSELHPNAKKENHEIVENSNSQNSRSLEKESVNWRNTIKNQTPNVLVNPFDDDDWVFNTEINEVYILGYDNGKKTIFKPTTQKDCGIRESIDFKQTPSSKREVVSFLISDKLGMNVVPFTSLTDRKAPFLKYNEKKDDYEMDKSTSRQGSEQEFIEGETWQETCIKLGEENLGEFVLKDSVNKDLSKIAILDYLIGSSDRHGKNLMVDSNNKIYAIDNGVSFADGNHKSKFTGEGEFRSLPTDVLFRVYGEYDSDYSLSNMLFEHFNVTEYQDELEQYTKLQIIQDAGGIHPEVSEMFENMDYQKAQKDITESMKHYGMEEKLIKQTLSRLDDIQNLFQ